MKSNRKSEVRSWKLEMVRPATGNRQLATLVLLILFLAACNNDGAKKEESKTPVITGKETYTDTGSSSVRVFDENGRVCIQQSNTYYEMTNVYEGATKIPLLLKVKKTELCFADSVNKHKVYEVSAKSVGGAKDVQWEAQFTGTNLEFTDNTMLVTHEGVDSEEDFFKRFNLMTGEEVFSCSYGELKIAIPNVRGKQFVGFTSRRAATEPLKKLNEENLLGVLMYSTGQKNISMLNIKLKRSKVADRIQPATPDMVMEAVPGATTAIENGKTVILMNADEHYTAADVKDFSVKMTFFYGDDNEFTDVIIPVVNNQLDVAHAKFDKEIFEISSR